MNKSLYRNKNKEYGLELSDSYHGASHQQG